MSSSPEPLRGVLFGHGRMGRLHAEKLATRSDVTLDIVDPKHGPSASTHSATDFAVIATPTSTHAEVALPLLERGIPCLIEKPLAHTAEDARRLAAHPKLSVGHVERFNPAIAPVATCRPHFVQIERLAPFSPRGTDVDVISDLMTHDLDLILGWMPPQLDEVRAVGVGVVTDNVDIVNARLEFSGADGRRAVAVLTASRVSRTRKRTVRLVEPGVYWTIDLQARTTTRIRWGEGELEGEAIEVVATDPLTAEHTAFLDAVRGHRPFPCPGVDGLKTIELAQRIRACL